MIEDNNPKALINNPITSSAFIFNRDNIKYMNITKLIICENMDNASPVLILLKKQDSYYSVN
jgi:hypothetical protein